MHAKESIISKIWEFHKNRQIVQRVNSEFSDINGIFFRKVRFPNPFLFILYQNDSKNIWANYYYRNNTDLILGHSIVELQKIHFKKPNAKFISLKKLLLCHFPVITIIALIRIYKRPNGVETIAAL